MKLSERCGVSQALAPSALVASPPPMALRLPLLSLMSGWAPSARRQLEEALASEVCSGLTSQRYVKVLMCYEALLV